jgi:sugar/nucleoside kinase (ribokinase family)
MIMNLNNVLATLKQHKGKLNLTIGFDGFVDNIMHVVDKRLDGETFTRIETIADYGNRITKASGLSTNIEWILAQQKIGGNGPIMANALLKHNPNVTYIGALGYPNLHPVFKQLADKTHIVSLEDPGFSDAIEFYDGKIIMGRMSFKEMTYERIIKTFGEKKFLELLSNTDMLASVNWSMLPTMTQLWKDLLKHVIPRLSLRAKKPIFFVDIADPEKRPSKDIQEALHLLKSFKSYFTVILGFNKKEAYDVAVHLNLFNEANIKSQTLESVAVALANSLQVDQLVVHPVDRAAVVVNHTYTEVKGPFVEKPKLTTGAGDNFNAGYVFGQLIGLSPEESLLTGVCTSGFYVRQAYSPSTSELHDFIIEFTK